MSNSANNDYITIHADLIKIINQLAKEIEVELDLAGKSYKEVLDSNTPLIRAGKLKIPDKIFLQYMHKVGEFLIEKQEPLRRSVEEIIDNIKEKNILTLAEAAINIDVNTFKRFGRERDINAGLVQMMSEMAYRVFVKAITDKLIAEEDVSNYRNNQCPVCSEIVRMSTFMEGDKERRALCTRCDMVWHLNINECPHCGEKDPEILGYIKAGGEDLHKIFTCNTCNCYVKEVLPADLENKPSHFVVDLQTVYLDMFAAQNKYSVPLISNEAADNEGCACSGSCKPGSC